MLVTIPVLLSFDIENNREVGQRRNFSRLVYLVVYQIKLNYIWVYECIGMTWIAFALYFSNSHLKIILEHKDLPFSWIGWSMKYCLYFHFFFSFRCYLKLTMNPSQNFVIYCMIKIKWYFYFGRILNLIESNKMIEMSLDKVLLNSKKFRISSKYHYGYLCRFYFAR